MVSLFPAASALSRGNRLLIDIKSSKIKPFSGERRVVDY